MVSSSVPTAANQASFRKLLMVAFCVAMMGLIGNLVHLHSLTTKFKNDPSDLITHYIMSDENDEAATKRQQPQQQQQQQQQKPDMTTQEQRQRRATLEEDSINNSNAKEEQPEQQQQQPATVSLLRRLLRESIDSLEACRRARVASLLAVRTDGAQNSNNHINNGGSRRKLLEDASPVHRRPLARFGWLNTLTNYLATSSLDSVQTMQQQQRLHEECSIPSSQPACHVQHMSMLVLSQGTDLRCLFVNLLSWLLYASVAEITVLLPTDVWSTLTQNVKYGRRIQAWHDDSNHKVHLIPYNQSLWDGIRSYHQHSPTKATTTSDFIVFMNGDVRWRGNDDGLQAGMALWQRHPASVVASTLSMTRLRVHPPPVALATRRESGSGDGGLPLCKHQTLHHDNETAVQSSFRRLKEEEENQAPDAVVTNVDTQQQPPVNRNQNDEQDDRSSFSILDMSGLMLHRNYLCLLAHHHVVKPLTHFASSFQEAQVAMSILLTLASSGTSSMPMEGATTASQPLLPRLYPLRVSRQNVTTTIQQLNKTTTMDSISPMESAAITRSRRLRSSANQRFLVEDDAGQSNGVISMSLDDTTITNIMGYFGSLPPKPLPWCTPGTPDDKDRTKCSSLSRSEDSLPDDLAWMRPEDLEHDLCPSSRVR